MKTHLHRLSLILIVLLVVGTAAFFSFRLDKQSKIAGIETTVLSTDQNIKGIILPHHKRALSLIDQSLARINANQQYSYLVIFGPNHFFPEKLSMVTASEIADTQIGTEFISRLINRFPSIKDNQSIIEGEHSIMLHLSYIKQYFPQTKIVPLIFSPSFNPNELNKLSSFLAENLPPDTLYLASIDFSHQSNAWQGLDKNKETINVLKNFDYNTLYSFGDDHLDSSVAVAVWLMTLQKLNAIQWETWQSSHTAILADDQSIRGTSYLVGVFH